VNEAGYAFFEVEADIGVRAWGARPEDAFAQAALGALALAVDPLDVDVSEQREVRAQGDTEEALLVTWINECLYVHEIEGFVVRNVTVDAFGGGMIHGLLSGEEFDRSRHRPGTIVKAATFHGVRIVRTSDRVEVAVVLDV
jgi:SHS2 domain-containing protein